MTSYARTPVVAAQTSLSAALADAVARWPDRTFIRIDGQDVTFAALEDQIASLAAGFSAAGVGVGDRVGVFMSNSLACLHTWFAANRLGAIWAPINTQFRGLTLEHVCQLTDARLFVADAQLLPELITAASRAGLDTPIVANGGTAERSDHESLADLYRPERAPVSPSNFADPAAFLFTSGTTGPSKACVLSHEYFVEQATVLIRDFELRQEDVLYCPFPLFHADATALTTVPALLMGATAAIGRRFSASQFWNEVRAVQATVFDFMGATLSILHKAPEGSDDADNPVRLAWGVPVPEWVDEFERRFDLRILELYGSVEASVPITQPLNQPRVIGSCGRVAEGFEVRIHDADDNPVAPGEVGEIVVRARRPGMLFDGYFGMPEATLKAFGNLWFHSGDLGRADAEGNFYFVGRMKDAIRRRGENISAYEVEEGLLLHDDVLECAVVGVPSELTEEEIRAFVVTRPGSGLSAARIVAHARQTLARFQVPRYIDFVETLPKTPTGKITKQDLSKRALEPSTWDREAVEGQS